MLQYSYVIASFYWNTTEIKVFIYLGAIHYNEFAIKVRVYERITRIKNI